MTFVLYIMFVSVYAWYYIHIPQGRVLHRVRVEMAKHNRRTAECDSVSF